MSRKIVCHFFIFVISLFLSSAAYAADVASIETAETEDWAIVLRDTALYLEGNEKNPARTQGYLVLVRQVRSRADKAKANFQKDLQQSERLLRAIGPPPAKGGPPEAREIAEKREMYNRQAVVARARMADADLAIIRATELEETLSRERLERFLGDMSRRTPIPIAPGVLAKGVPEIAAEVRRILGSPFDWFAKLPPGVSGTAVLLPGIVVLILGVGFGWGNTTERLEHVRSRPRNVGTLICASIWCRHRRRRWQQYFAGGSFSGPLFVGNPTGRFGEWSLWRSAHVFSFSHVVLLCGCCVCEVIALPRATDLAVHGTIFRKRAKRVSFDFHAGGRFFARHVFLKSSA